MPAEEPASVSVPSTFHHKKFLEMIPDSGTGSDGIPKHLDSSSDSDGKPDYLGADSNGDGKPDYADEEHNP